MDEEGYREVLAVEVAGAEKSAAYASMLRGLLDRGLCGVMLVVSDDNEGTKRAVADCLHREKRVSMLLWVLENDPARGFHERLGGRRLSSQEIEIAGVILTEVAYGWSALDKTAEKARYTVEADG